MRGTPALRVRIIPVDGIIPADAGNTVMPEWLLTWITDHPRGCGEHSEARKDKERERGSSPRMRGTPDPGHDRHRHRGIIPADAGNTVPDWANSFMARDHPRGCGEHPS